MQLRNFLDAHMIAEEDVLYSRLREHLKSKDQILESFEEHHVAKLLSDEIADLSPDDEVWMAKVSVLKDMIHHHVDEEESKVFHLAKKIFSKKKLSDLNREFEIRQDEFIERQLIPSWKVA